MPDNGDVVILRSATAAAPKNYAVPGSQHFVPLVVEALFDGSGAAGAYLPAVVLLGPSGDVIGRGLAPEVAAGSSAEVTFRPFLNKSADSGITIDYGGYNWGNTVPLSAAGDSESFDSIVHEWGSDLLDTSNIYSPAVKDDGLYTFTFRCRQVTGVATSGSYAGTFSNVVFYVSTIPAPLFSQVSCFIEAEVAFTNIYPDASCGFTLPMKTGDYINGYAFSTTPPSGDPFKYDGFFAADIYIVRLQT